MTTRRTMFKLFGAAALPMGFRAPAPQALAAEAGAVEVLDADEAEREIVDRERWHLFIAPEQGRLSCATLFLERFADGTANLVFEMPKPLPKRWTDEEIDAHRDVFRYSADLDRVVLNAPIDASTFAEIDRGLQMVKGA